MLQKAATLLSSLDAAELERNHPPLMSFPSVVQVTQDNVLLTFVTQPLLLTAGAFLIGIYDICARQGDQAARTSAAEI